MGAWIRTSGEASAYEMSLESATTLLTLVPEATATSYIVTVGPRCAPTTWASTPNVCRVRSRAASVSFSARESALEGGAVRNRSSGGSWYGPNGDLTVRDREPLVAGSAG